MVRLIVTGPPGSGKSALAERIARGWRNPDVGYLATLEAVGANELRIRRHRELRPQEWRTIEASGVPNEDLRRVAAQLETDGGIILEGIVPLLMRIVPPECDSYRQAWPYLEPLHRGLLEILTEAVRDWVVVDVSWDSIRDATPLWAAHAARRFQWMFESISGVRTIRLDPNSSRFEPSEVIS